MLLYRFLRPPTPPLPKIMTLIIKYTNLAYRHSELLKAKIVGPSRANEPRVAGLRQLAFSKYCTMPRCNKALVV